MAERAHPEDKGFKDSWFGLKRSKYKRYLLQRYDFCNKYIRNKTVLDVPCGVGWGTSFLKKAKKIYGIDIESEAVDYAKRKFSKKNCEFRTGDMQSLPFKKDCFDVVICLEGFEHVSREAGLRFLMEAKKVLKSNGLFIMTTPILTNGRHSGNPYHLYEPALDEIVDILKKNFATLDLEVLKGPEGNILRFVGKNSFEFAQSCIDFIESQKTKTPGAYAMCEGGQITLYSSCFAAMLARYLGVLPKLTYTERKKWADYINGWQDEGTGLYIGPEIVKKELTSPRHKYEHITMHLCAHVLPALAILGLQPTYPLTFAHRFLDQRVLLEWLEARDWKDAWLEGNNLLFVGQFLIHLRDHEKMPKATRALELYFDWLDSKVDPKTGLWGTNGYCSPFVAMCGGYHQLLVYYHESRDIKYKERLIDTVLSLQHADGGFSPRGGGGACEDVDAADILVNMYKLTDYRRLDIRIALRKLLASILSKQMDDGGFVYRLNEPFTHMGIAKTFSPSNKSNMFATWFRIHTIALISEVLTDEPISTFDWKFNSTCSMGWHRKWDKRKYLVMPLERKKENFKLMVSKLLP